jgi:hypothetical protein
MKNKRSSISRGIYISSLLLILGFVGGCRTCPAPVIETRTETFFVYPAKAATVERPTLEVFPFPAAFDSASEEMRANVGALLRNLSGVMAHSEQLEIIVSRYGDEIDRVVERERKAKEDEQKRRKAP